MQKVGYARISNLAQESGSALDGQVDRLRDMGCNPILIDGESEKREKTKKGYDQYLAENPGAVADPIGALEKAILALDGDDDDRGRERNDLGWSGATRIPGADFAKRIRSGWSLSNGSDAQVALAHKLVNTHRRQVANIVTVPSDRDVSTYIQSRSV